MPDYPTRSECDTLHDEKIGGIAEKAALLDRYKRALDQLEFNKLIALTQEEEYAITARITTLESQREALFGEIDTLIDGRPGALAFKLLLSEKARFVAGTIGKEPGDTGAAGKCTVDRFAQYEHVTLTSVATSGADWLITCKSGAVYRVSEHASGILLVRHEPQAAAIAAEKARYREQYS